MLLTLAGLFSYLNARFLRQPAGIMFLLLAAVSVLAGERVVAGGGPGSAGRAGASPKRVLATGVWQEANMLVLSDCLAHRQARMGTSISSTRAGLSAFRVSWFVSQVPKPSYAANCWPSMATSPASTRAYTPLPGRLMT